MKTLYLHVGPHKTGTTAIQKFMLDNQKAFFQRGTLYPKRFLRIFGHHLMRDKLADKALDSDDIAFFKDSDCNFIISSEDMISLSKEHFVYLKQSLPFLQVKVVFSWRRASYKLYSIWQEVIKHGGTEDFFEYYHEHMARPAMSQMLSPDLKLGMFSQVFGKDNIVVIDYDASAAKSALIDDFLFAVGLAKGQAPIDAEQLIKSEDNASVRNASMSVEDTETVRILNLLMREDASESQGGEIRTLYQDNKAQLAGEDLDNIHHAIRSHIHPRRIGNYAIDVRAEKIMAQQYAQNMFNYEPVVGSKEVLFPSTQWLMVPGVQDSVQRIANKLKQLSQAE